MCQTNCQSTNNGILKKSLDNFLLRFLGNDDNEHETMLTAAEFVIVETIVRCYTTLDLKVIQKVYMLSLVV